MRRSPGRNRKNPESTGASGERRLAGILVSASLFFLAPALSWAQEPEPAASSEQVKELTVEPSRGYIYSLLIDKEAPILGIKWGSQIFVDTPLNGEPEGASTTLRRAQINLQKAFTPHLLGKLTLNYDTAGGFELGDNYLRYTGWKTRIAQVGVFDPPFSLDSVTKAVGLTFMERALPVYALSETKSGGIGVLKRTPNSILNAAVFFVSPRYEDVAQSGQALVMHYVHSPIDFTRLGSLHLGASFSYRMNVNPNVTEFKTRPEVATANDYYVDTGTIDTAQKVIRGGLEVHKQAGRFSWQSEALTTVVQRQEGKNLRFWGAYMFFSWFLTDDSRNYDAGLGRFLAVEPTHPLGKGGKGAWEVALRGSYVDLTSRDVIGGEQTNITLGLNWYLNRNFRLMTNLVKVLDVKRPGSEYNGLDPWIFSLRFQWQML